MKSSFVQVTLSHIRVKYCSGPPENQRSVIREIGLMFGQFCTYRPRMVAFVMSASLVSSFVRSDSVVSVGSDFRNSVSRLFGNDTCSSCAPSGRMTPGHVEPANSTVLRRLQSERLTAFVRLFTFRASNSSRAGVSESAMDDELNSTLAASTSPNFSFLRRRPVMASSTATVASPPLVVSCSPLRSPSSDSQLAPRI